MNKEELIKAVEELPANCRDLRPLIDKWTTLELIKLLDEPEKVKVPQFVADWIKHSRNTGCSLFGAMSIFEENIDIKKWMQWAENQELFAQAWIFGYEVEEEKRYYVRFKWIEESYSYLTLIKHLDTWTLTNIKLDKKFRSEHTRKQLEDADFGWVFDCEGIEIEEVE